MLYGRWGRPWTNRGVGLEFPACVRWGRSSAGFGLDVWDQEQFGTGANLHVLADIWLGDGFGLTGKIGWKREGYLMGQPQAGGVYGYSGVSVTY